MTNKSNQPKLNPLPKFILMAVCDVLDNEDVEAVLAFEDQPKKLLEAIGCNSLEEVQAAYDKLSDKHECDFVLTSPKVDTAIHLAMQLSVTGSITHDDVFKSLEVDRLLSWPALHHPSSYLGAIRYLTDKAEKSPHELTAIEQMAMVAAALSGLGGSFKAQPAAHQATFRKNAHHYVSQLIADDCKYVHDNGIRHMVKGILNIFEPGDAPVDGLQITAHITINENDGELPDGILMDVDNIHRRQ